MVPISILNRASSLVTFRTQVLLFLGLFDILTHTPSSLSFLSLLPLTPAAQTSRLFSLFSSSALGWISQEPLTTNNHYFAVTTDTFKNNPKLTEFFTVLSTNMDRDGVEFVSTVESEILYVASYVYSKFLCTTFNAI